MTDDARQQLLLAVDPALRAPVLTSSQLGLHVRGDEPRVVAEGDLPLGLLRDDRGVRERARAIRAEQAAGVVEMEVAHRHDIDGLGQEARRLERRHDRRALVAAHGPGLVVDPLADAGLDQDPPGRRLDQQAVQRLEQTVLVRRSRRVTRRSHSTRGTGPNSVPASDRNVPAWTSATRVPAAEIGPPVDRVVERHAAQSFSVEVPVERRRGRLLLALVARAQLRRPVRPIDRATTS